MKTNLAKVIFMIMIIPPATNATITDVSILPTTPTVIDPITISVSGIEGSGGVRITDTDFYISGDSLELDIFLELGPLAVITPWSYSENIGILPADTYNLTVRSFSYYPSRESSYLTRFEVVPEPSTFAFLFFALPFFRDFSRRKTKGLR
jgi:hypothetical protein